MKNIKMKNIKSGVFCFMLALCLAGCKAAGGADPAEAADSRELVESAQSAQSAQFAYSAQSAQYGEGSEGTGSEETAGERSEITVLAAASLTDACGELERMYEERHPECELLFSYGSSGALQTQIEEGAPADIFFSAALKQMDALESEGLMDEESIRPLLENKIVLAVPKGSGADITSFEDAAGDKVKMIALGEPESVPAGQYAEEVFASLEILDDVKAKANYGSDVRTVLAWVEEGTVDCGVVYATDAYASDRVEIAATAPEGSCKRVIYPVGVTASCENREAAGRFLDFLSSDEAMKVFESYGFSKAE